VSQKTRALRKIRLDTYNGSAEEVDPKAFIDRGINFELTDIDIGGKFYCTVAFEAYPDDSAMHDAFTRTVETFLDALEGVDLDAGNSMSYPAWLLGGGAGGRSRG
jgi:hypothetical protein